MSANKLLLMSLSVEEIFSKDKKGRAQGFLMKNLNGRIRLPAPDLMRFTGCVHATAVDLASLQGRGGTPRKDIDDASLQQKPDDAHNAAHLKCLNDEGWSVIRIVHIILAKITGVARTPMIPLREALPATIRVGAVDNFQCQEPPVCLVWMSAFSAEKTSRKIESLVPLNRFKVAASRAKSLSLVCGRPRRWEAKCEMIEQMQLVKTFSALPTWSPA
jgi:hypothetical protein